MLWFNYDFVLFGYGIFLNVISLYNSILKDYTSDLMLNLRLNVVFGEVYLMGNFVFK